MAKTFHPNSAVRIFAISGIVTLGGLLAVLIGLGSAALLTTIVLVVIEVVFSFDNAIINAKVLERLNHAWQTAFLTIGIVIAIFGMRLLFPLVIVGIAAHLSIGNVWHLALQHPDQYADKLQLAHPLIAAFGGAFLLLLALEFFLNGQHKILWWDTVERRLKQFGRVWLPAVLTVLIVLILAKLSSDHGGQILRAGLLGVATFIIVQLLTSLLSRKQPHGKHLTGWAAFSLFIYLQVLDASFSFDGVIGAFAITNKVVLIAAGLGIGALWVRSMTIFLVRRGTLGQYKYLEHGAYYTITVLAAALLLSLFVDVPDAITGLIGLGIIGSAVVASVQAKRATI
ncbi:MAG: DUF475 domain-containing protein [Candidatus Saccharimonadales bacterium]